MDFGDFVFSFSCYLLIIEFKHSRECFIKIYNTSSFVQNKTLPSVVFLNSLLSVGNPSEKCYLAFYLRYRENWTHGKNQQEEKCKYNTILFATTQIQAW